MGFSYDRETSPDSGGPRPGTAAAPQPPPAQQAQQAVPEPGPGEPPFLAPFPVPEALQGALPATDRHFKVKREGVDLLPSRAKLRWSRRCRPLASHPILLALLGAIDSIV